MAEWVKTGAPHNLTDHIDFLEDPNTLPDKYIIVWNSSLQKFIAKDNWSKVQVYKSGTEYSAGDLVTDSGYTTLYIVVQDYTSISLISDINSGLIKPILSSAGSTASLVYKTYDAPNVTAGTTIQINFVNPNVLLNRDVFILKLVSQGNVSVINIQPTLSWNTTQYVLIDTTIHLKTVDNISVIQEGSYYVGTIDLTKYNATGDIYLTP